MRKWIVIGVVAVCALLAWVLWVYHSSREHLNETPLQVLTGAIQPIENEAMPFHSSESGETTGRVSIVILGKSGENLAPLASAMLGVLYLDSPANQVPDRRELTVPEDGIAVLEKLKLGRWQAIVLAPGHFGHSQQFQISAEKSEQLLEITLEAFSGLRGIVQDKRGQPITDAEFRVFIEPDENRMMADLHPLDRQTAGQERGQTDSNGRFLIPILPCETPFRILFAHPEKRQNEMEFPPLAAGEIREIQVTLDEPTSLRGHVLHAGTPQDPTTVELFHVESKQQLIGEQRVEVDSEGRFRFRNIKPGRKRLQACRQDQHIIELGILCADAKEYEETDVGLVPVHNSNFVVTLRAETERTDRRASLEVFFVQADATKLHCAFLSRYTNQPLLDVPLEFRGFPAGEFRATANLISSENAGFDARFLPASVNVLFDGSSANTEIRIARKPVQQLGHLKVLLENPPGISDEAWNARVSLLREGNLVLGYPRNVSSAGFALKEFTFQDQAIGEYEVIAFVRGFWARSNPVLLQNAEFREVKIQNWQRAAPIQVNVRDVNGNPVPRAYLHIIRGLPAKPQENPFSTVLFQDQANDQGLLQIEGLPMLDRLRIFATKTRVFRPLKGGKELDSALVGNGGALELVLE